MYRINPLLRDVLITTDEVIFHAPTKHTLDPRTIQQSIIVAEERLVRPALGDGMYYDIARIKNQEITDDNRGGFLQLLPEAGLVNGDVINAMEFLSVDYLLLWKQHLWKLTAECVMLLSTPEAFVQFSSAGVTHSVPASGPMTTAGEVSPTLATVKWMMDKKMMDRVDPLMEAMHTWLCANKRKYPLYKKDCGCDTKGVAYKRKSDLVLGLYDDVDNHENCNCYED
ncbi:hypothetical protein SAMN05444266_101609 [Chitinophaga jiangningensis]|uniref:Uncharacterized protein n=1 Tax=Chitinophaga jiangningensis TaxID=1419482 RepID=A0A1M6WFK4_9BACT|nr:hypothetical protein [Chitinophaga jiangningensis]SHK92552.1 hypothetical protein SAMN05444266_101609 [Chitinophaga jiangningensis]